MPSAPKIDLDGHRHQPRPSGGFPQDFWICWYCCKAYLTVFLIKYIYNIGSKSNLRHQEGEKTNLPNRGIPSNIVHIIL